MALCLLMPATFCIDTHAQWVDITKYYLSNTGFDNGSDQGWTYWFNGGTCNRREGSMEFWNNNSFFLRLRYYNRLRLCCQCRIC